MSLVNYLPKFDACLCVCLSFFVRHFSYHVEFCILQLRLSDDIIAISGISFPGQFGA